MKKRKTVDISYIHDLIKTIEEYGLIPHDSIASFIQKKLNIEEVSPIMVKCFLLGQADSLRTIS